MEARFTQFPTVSLVPEPSEAGGQTFHQALSINHSSLIRWIGLDFRFEDAVFLLVN